MARLKHKRWERFTREYVRNGFNGAKAARAVGCTVVSSSEMASKWLRKDKILKRVDELADDINDDCIMDAQELLHEASAMAGANIADCYDEEGVLLHPAAMERNVSVNVHEIQSVGTNITSIKYGRDKRAAMEYLAKYHNLFKGHQEAGAANIYLDEKDAQA